MKEKLVIIDGNSLINRAFYALPLLSNSKGEFSNGVYGFVNILVKAIFDINPKYIVVALDYGKKTFRNKLYEEYKAKRKPTPNELKSQFPLLKEMLNSMNITYIEKEGYEADDIIGTLSKKYETDNIIITGDRDALQLINDNTEVWLTKKGITEVKVMNEKSYKEEYGLVPSQVVDLKALMGDSSDNIPGVLGVGEKTALELMREYGSLDNVYKNLENIKGKLQEKLVNSKEMAYLSQNLATIRTDVPLEYKLEDFTYTFPFNKKVFDFFKEYDFNSLIKRDDLFVGVENKSNTITYSANRIELSSIDTILDQLKYIKKAGEFYFELNNDIFSFAYDKNCEFYSKVQGSLIDGILDIGEILNALKDIFEDEKIKKFVYDKKSLRHILDKFNINLKGVVFDVTLAFYLLYAGERDANKKNIIQMYKLDENFEAINIIYLTETLIKELTTNNLNDLYYKIEFPLIDVLYDMENFGFKINIDVLRTLEDKYSQEADNLEKEIIELAGKEFNVNSPKQLGEILFDKLGLVSANNKKKSTSIEHLEEMFDMHPIIEKIIDYRKIKKILSTYIEPYKELVNDDNQLIHTIFNQTLTATGRLSSSEPNLQNIPVRDKEGKNLRKMFVSRYEDGALISADYSQIELRLLAHFSKDDTLLKAFKENIDIHTITASEVFGVDIKDVDASLRRTAKAVNFGIIYGISEFSLAQNVGCTRYQARDYINKYFNRYKKIKEYMDKNIASAKETGYAYTLYNRRRKINEIFSSNYNTRQFGERVAMNMPLQGSASDIIKLAMIDVYNALNDKKMKSELILQVHDELIIDCPKNEIDEVVKLLKEKMENVVKLNVPLLVDVNYGKSWFDC